MGHPRRPEDFAWMRAYSPYDNLPPAGIRPDLLVTGARHDPRVMVTEPAKWVAALRHSDPEWSPRCLFRAETGAAAYVGPSGRFARLGYEAEVCAWVLDRLVAQRLLDQLAEPFHLDGVPLRIGASIGVAVCPEHAVDTNGLLQRADVAMYAAKAAGGGVRRYDPAHDQYSRERLRTVEELRIALRTDQLTVHYQPQCDVASGAVVGLEALVRWKHPVRGLLSPDQFLPLVERTGLMPALTEHVLGQSVRQCHQWRLDGLELGISVNLSASSLLDQRLPEQVSWLLTSNNLPADALTLELTENTLMADPDQGQATLMRLKELGVWLSIDDYGTGYCSLSYLQKLPVDELKLDRVFLTNLQNSRNAAIVRSTIDLAHALELRMVAEGVEDQQSLELLRQLGCDTAQGYHLSRPMSAAAMTNWLRDQPDTRPTAGLPMNFLR